MVQLIGQPYGQLGIPSHCRDLFRAIRELEPSSKLFATHPQAYNPDKIYDLQGLTDWKDYRYANPKDRGLFFWPPSDIFFPMHNTNVLTVFESTEPKLTHFNDAKSLHTCSVWGTRILESLNLNCPIGTPIYAGINSDFFYSTERTYEPPVKFLIVGKWEKRKGIVEAIRAFTAVCDDPKKAMLTLLVGDPFDKNFSIVDKLKELNIPQKGLINVIEDPLETRSKVGDLYRSNDVILAPSYGEAAGLPILEAMGCGVVPITTNWSAPPEYVGPEGILIEVDRLEDTSDNRWFRNKGQLGQWAIPRFDDLCAILQRIIRDPESLKYYQPTLRAKQFTWEKSAQQALQQIMK